MKESYYLYRRRPGDPIVSDIMVLGCYALQLALVLKGRVIVRMVVGSSSGCQNHDITMAAVAGVGVARDRAREAETASPHIALPRL